MGDIVGRIRGGVWRYERNQEIQAEVSETRRAAPWGGALCQQDNDVEVV